MEKKNNEKPLIFDRPMLIVFVSFLAVLTLEAWHFHGVHRSKCGSHSTSARFSHKIAAVYTRYLPITWCVARTQSSSDLPPHKHTQTQTV